MNSSDVSPKPNAPKYRRLCVIIGGVNNLVDAGCSWVSRCINDVDATGLETWQDQPGSGLGRIRVAAGAGVPAGVMDLVINMRQLQTMNHLTISTTNTHTFAITISE